ncbi:MAG: hypothetical protein V4564_10040 [Pseudomonadota bacterium]|uniref:hypothetical protein n=1 Tax=Sphingomonas sp. ERG5 TaxID=1381597 RepID=UPI00068AC60F|nr:hypothetical protein [Sphingomonas sp. ERG5]
MRRLSGALAAITVGIFGCGSAPDARAQSLSPSAAPVEWVTYAEAATVTIASWLQGEGEAAARLRTYLETTRPMSDKPTQPLELKIWIEPDGRISRTDFAPFADTTANADLRGLIVGHSLTTPPPKGMLLPLRLLIQLEPSAATTPTDRAV